jgi:hypothetical protein
MANTYRAQVDEDCETPMQPITVCSVNQKDGLLQDLG